MILLAFSARCDPYKSTQLYQLKFKCLQCQCPQTKNNYLFKLNYPFKSALGKQFYEGLCVANKIIVSFCLFFLKEGVIFWNSKGYQL